MSPFAICTPLSSTLMPFLQRLQCPRIGHPVFNHLKLFKFCLPESFQSGLPLTTCILKEDLRRRTMFSSKEGITNARNHKNKQTINQTREREICIRSIRRESYWYQGLGWTCLPGVKEERRWVSPIWCPWKSVAWALRRGAEKEWTRNPDGEMGRQWKPLSARWAIWPHT